MADLVAAIGLVLVIEGVAYAAFPQAMQRAVALLMQAPESALRRTGMVAAATGVLIVWLVRG